MRRAALLLVGLLAVLSAGRIATAPAQIIPPLPTPAPTLTPTPTPSPSPTPTTSPTPASAPAPAPVLPPPESELLVPELASDAFPSPRMVLRWRGRGGDDGRVAGFRVEVRATRLRHEADWRTLVAGAPARAAVFTGAPGETYAVRVRARASGTDAYGPTASATVLVPLDERDPRVRLSRGWRKQRRSGAWNGATAVAASRSATARLRFTQRRVRVLVRRSPSAGRLAVVLDGRRTVVPLAGPGGSRQVAFDSGPLRGGRHRLTLSPAGGRVEIDAIAPG